MRKLTSGAMARTRETEEAHWGNILVFIQPFSHETSHAIATGRTQSLDIINKIVWGVRLVTRDQLVLKNTNLKHAIEVGSVDHNCLRPKQWTHIIECAAEWSCKCKKETIFRASWEILPWALPSTPASTPTSPTWWPARWTLPEIIDHIHPGSHSWNKNVFSVLKKICVSRRRLRRQWEWTGRAWLPSSYSTSQCSWWKTWKKKKLLYHHLLILAYVQSVTVQAFLGCANVPIIFNYRHIGTIGT